MRKIMYTIMFVFFAGVLFLSGPAAAVDVKFSGQWLFEGWYEQNRNLVDVGGTGTSSKNSLGFADSSFLLTTKFQVADGLSLTTRARILDKIWGDKMGSTFQVSANGTSPDTQNRPYDTNRWMRENIEFERVYVTFKALKGQFDVGTQVTSMLGPDFGNTDESRPIIKYTYRTGPWNFYVLWQKETESEVRNSTGSSNSPASYSNMSDIDYDQWKYYVGYTAPTWDAGFGGTYYRDKSHRGDASPYTAVYHKLNPFARGTFGSFYVEAEVILMIGESKDYDPAASVISQDRRGWSWYGMARYNLGPVYFGGQYAYVQGDDPGTTERSETGYASGREYKPCLILLNSDRDKYLGALGNGTALQNNYSNKGSSNFSLYQGFVGYRPLPKLNLAASYTYMTLDKKPAGYLDDKVGNELDLSATYKLYDNLEYMVGFGYLWAGDAWKGTSASMVVGNDWLLMHRLTLNF